jgi:hypothetical protein
MNDYKISETDLLALMVLKGDMEGAFAFMDKMKEIKPEVRAQQKNELERLQDNRLHYMKVLDSCGCNSLTNECGNCKEHRRLYRTIISKMHDIARKQFMEDVIIKPEVKTKGNK